MGKMELIKGLPRDMWYKLLRGAVATVVSGWWASVQHDPNWLAMIPVIQMAGKFIRNRKPSWSWIIPF